MDRVELECAHRDLGRGSFAAWASLLILLSAGSVGLICAGILVYLTERFSPDDFLPSWALFYLPVLGAAPCVLLGAVLGFRATGKTSSRPRMAAVAAILNSMVFAGLVWALMR